MARVLKLNVAKIEVEIIILKILSLHRNLNDKHFLIASKIGDEECKCKRYYTDSIKQQIKKNIYLHDKESTNHPCKKFVVQ